MIIQTIFLSLTLTYVLRRYFQRSEEATKGNIVIFAQSDIGLCPRMQNHALAINHSFPEKLVYIVGYLQSKCHPNITSCPQIKLVHIPGLEFLERLKHKTRNLLFPIYAILKVMVQCFSTLSILLLIPPYKSLIVQNPPTIPTLCIAWIVCRIRGAKFIIDWHNFGCSLLDITVQSIKLLKFFPITRFAKIFEIFFGRLSDHNFCVSESMRSYMIEQWSIEADVLYDRPPVSIKPITLFSKHITLQKYFSSSEDNISFPEDSYTSFKPLCDNESSETNSHTNTHLKVIESYKIPCTYWNLHIAPNMQHDFENSSKPLIQKSIATELSIKKNYESYTLSIRNNNSRPAIILTSTSWSPDENIEMLLETFQLYNNSATKIDAELPSLFVIITGKNPNMEWLQKFNNMKLSYVNVTTLFAPMEDYYKLLALADLGISLHTSSSGLDLPMKIVDMQGAGLPTLAYYYETINEQILIGKNSETFYSPSTLNDLLGKVLKGFPVEFDQSIDKSNKKVNQLYMMRSYAEQHRPRSFNEEWLNVAKQHLP